MKENLPLELRVGVDVGCHSHNVAIGLSTGEILEEFSIIHHQEGFRQFFSRIEKNEKIYGCPVAVAMEGYKGGQGVYHGIYGGKGSGLEKSYCDLGILAGSIGL